MRFLLLATYFVPVICVSVDDRKAGRESRSGASKRNSNRMNMNMRGMMGMRRFPSLAGLLLTPTQSPSFPTSSSSGKGSRSFKGSAGSGSGKGSERDNIGTSSGKGGTMRENSGTRSGKGSGKGKGKGSASPSDQPSEAPSYQPTVSPTVQVSVFPLDSDIRDEPCDTTQESGGAGTSVLSFDVLQSQGSFRVFYDMFSIPDGLEINYEGQTIFTTGGLVPNSGDHVVTLPAGGTSTTVTAILTAPNSGTAWELFVGCASRR